MLSARNSAAPTRSRGDSDSTGNGPSHTSGHIVRNWCSAAAWNVAMCMSSPTPRSSRRVRISCAALTENVTASARDASHAPVAHAYAILRVIVRVLPAPAHAMMRTGPSTLHAARRCASSSPSRISFAEIAMAPLWHGGARGSSGTRRRMAGRAQLCVNTVRDRRARLRIRHESVAMLANCTLRMEKYRV